MAAGTSLRLNFRTPREGSCKEHRKLGDLPRLALSRFRFAFASLSSSVELISRPQGNVPVRITGGSMDIVGLLITLAIGAAAGWLAGLLVEGAGFRLALEHPNRHRRCLCSGVAISEIGSWFNPGRRHCRRYCRRDLGGGCPASGGQSDTTARQLSVGTIRAGAKASAGVLFVWLCGISHRHHGPPLSS